MDLAVDPLFADTAGDELGNLRPEVKDKDFLAVNIGSHYESFSQTGYSDYTNVRSSRHLTTPNPS
jgi:hypothetical protein